MNITRARKSCQHACCTRKVSSIVTPNNAIFCPRWLTTSTPRCYHIKDRSNENCYRVSRCHCWSNASGICPMGMGGPDSCSACKQTRSVRFSTGSRPLIRSPPFGKAAEWGSRCVEAGRCDYSSMLGYIYTATMGAAGCCCYYSIASCSLIRSSSLLIFPLSNHGCK